MNEPAFPMSDNPNYHEGLNKLEYFTAKAMQGFCACPNAWEERNLQELSELSIHQATETLKQLNSLTEDR